jgi:hypothetical protein
MARPHPDRSSIKRGARQNERQDLEERDEPLDLCPAEGCIVLADVEHDRHVTYAATTSDAGDHGQFWQETGDGGRELVVALELKGPLQEPDEPAALWAFLEMRRRGA